MLLREATAVDAAAELDGRVPTTAGTGSEVALCRGQGPAERIRVEIIDPGALSGPARSLGPEAQQQPLPPAAIAGGDQDGRR